MLRGGAGDIGNVEVIGSIGDGDLWCW